MSGNNLYLKSCEIGWRYEPERPDRVVFRNVRIVLHGCLIIRVAHEILDRRRIHAVVSKDLIVGMAHLVDRVRG